MELTLPPVSSCLPELRRTAALALRGVDGDVAEEVLLALDEAVGNAIRHGSGGRRPGLGPHDRARPRPHRGAAARAGRAAADPGRRRARPVADLPAGGRGPGGAVVPRGAAGAAPPRRVPARGGGQGSLSGAVGRLARWPPPRPRRAPAPRRHPWSCWTGTASPTGPSSPCRATCRPPPAS